jgi:hypothetical protein
MEFIYEAVYHAFTLRTMDEDMTNSIASYHFLCCKMFRILTMSFRHVQSIYSKIDLNFSVFKKIPRLSYLTEFAHRAFTTIHFCGAHLLRISIVSSLYLVTVRSTFSNQFTYLRKKKSFSKRLCKMLVDGMRFFVFFVFKIR